MSNETDKIAGEFRAQLDYQARVMGYLPRSVTFPEVQVGDTIRAEKPTGVVRVVQGEVTDIITRIDRGVTGLHLSDDKKWFILAEEGWSLTLLDRPKPDRPVGSLWYDPDTGAGYVRTDHPLRAYQWFCGVGWDSLTAGQPKVIDRLIAWADRSDAGLDAHAMPRCDCLDDPS